MLRILLVNKFFYRRGGDAVVFRDTGALLEQKGHQVAYFAMKDPRNDDGVDDQYFVDHIDYAQDKGVKKIKNALGILYSLEAKRKITKLVEKFRPDIAHLHNFCHQISPSIIHALNAKNIPVVVTLHDYKLTCGTYNLYRNGQTCEECAHGKHYRVVKNRCSKGSLINSAIAAIEMYSHHNVLKIFRHVYVFISPSKFLIEKSKQMGSSDRFRHLANFIDAKKFPVEKSYKEGRRVVYFGRLSEEKGVGTLIQAAKDISAHVRIIGIGPQLEELRQKVEKLAISNVEFVGYLSGDELLNEIESAALVVVPSLCYENNPRAILEAFALGKPVVGAGLGGIPELVRNGVTGETFTPGAAKQLSKKINALLNDDERRIRYGRNARCLVEKEYSAEKYYEGLMDVYRDAIAARAPRRTTRNPVKAHIGNATS